MKQAFKRDDSVVVKQRFRDLDTGVNLKGWQGRVVALHDDPRRGVELEIDWDSVTLQSLSYRYLERCSESDMPPDAGLIPPDKIETVPERDALADVERAQAAIHERYTWVAEFGKSGERIYQIVGGKKLDTVVNLAWEKHLNSTLKFPFSAYVDYIDEYVTRTFTRTIIGCMNSRMFKC